MTDARTFVARQLAYHRLIVEVDAVGLVATELATNAVLHARTPFTVTLARSDGALTVMVKDLSFGLPVSPVEGVLPERGRGLAMIAALSSAWGTTLLPDGKSVWATFDLG